MKSNICLCLISAFALFLAAPSYACGPYDFCPYGYRMYRVYDENPVKKIDERKMNSLLWQELTSKDIPLEDIEKVVYEYTLTQMKEILSVQSSNSFAEWIRNDKEIYDFLVLAKICEKTRSIMYDPWYYPSKNDGTYLSLREIEEKAKAYEGTTLKDRYVLQAIRAMFSNKRYQECVDYWESVEDSLPDGLIKDMARSYLQGAYFKLGRMDDALEYFIEVGDLNSIIFCLRKQGKVTDLVSELEYIAKYVPDSDQIPEYLQDIVSAFEPWGDEDSTYIDRMKTSLILPEEREVFDHIYRLSSRMAKTADSYFRAEWAYTAAFLADLDARPLDAWKHIQTASQYKTTDFMKESIRVMRMYLDAKVSVYDSSYESRLYSDLQWLDNKIKNNINDKVREYASDRYGNRLRYNISFYYWNDMMRRILLAEVCPRMIDRGMHVRSLQLANMADNRLLNLVGMMGHLDIDEFRKSDEYNCVDYCGDFFWTMYDEVTVDQLMAYINRTKFPKSDFDEFLNKRGYIDYELLYDMAGTKCIKERDYTNAVKYLSKISSSYQSRLNTSGYMKRDPFSMDYGFLNDSTDYKLRFATEMSELSCQIENGADGVEEALAMIKYGIGMQNSVDFCWTLTNYRLSYLDEKYHEYIKQTLKVVEGIYDDALAILSHERLNESERELAAIGLVKLCRWKTAVEMYPETYASRYTKAMCDNLCDYSVGFLL